jgi:hypothetical protein
MAYYHQQRYIVEKVQRCQSVDAVSEARILHDQRRLSAPHPGPGAQPHALFLASDRNMNDFVIALYLAQELLKIDARHTRREVDTGALETAINGEAGFHNAIDHLL